MFLNMNVPKKYRLFYGNLLFAIFHSIYTYTQTVARRHKFPCTLKVYLCMREFYVHLLERTASDGEHKNALKRLNMCVACVHNNMAAVETHRAYKCKPVLQRERDEDENSIKNIHMKECA